MKQLLSIKIVALIICLFSVSKATGQMLDDVRINEIQVINKDGFKDNFGQALSWIELFNTGYGQVNIGGAILKVNGKEYRIPRTKEMVIPTRGYVIFFASGQTDKGAYYTNFTLENTDFIELYSPDDLNTPIDRLTFNPAEMKEDVTYGWFKDESGVEKVMNLPVITPGATNNTLETVHRSELFRQADPSGGVLTITAVVVVGLNLFLLYIIFAYIGKMNMKIARRKEEKALKAIAEATNTKVVAGKEDVLTNEELAAIAIALFKYSEDLHDIEDTVLTINRAAKAYSPWSSKIYGLRQSLIKR
ncbi:OadG family transporter subunit [Massilibacteroides vaginae]|uniref:OadG family transporter subunit n=1 Tax=Massilibacteroides vaginae TaxID=1673718 RepID=UPI000A1CD7C8|nr:OadG family transporter subunit [Massilibacteroides vaginae]